MSKLAVMLFPDEKKAYEGVHALQELHAEGSVTVYGTDVLQRGADGAVWIVKRDDRGPIGTAVGTLAGGLVGLLGGPVGAAVGATVGGTAGVLRDLFHLGVSDEFLGAVERDLAPGTFAVIAEMSEEWFAPLDTRMQELGAKVVREDRLGFEVDAFEKRVSARQAHLANLKAERAGRRAERARDRAGTKAEEMMQKLLTDEIEYARRDAQVHDRPLRGAAREREAGAGRQDRRAARAGHRREPGSAEPRRAADGRAPQGVRAAGAEADTREGARSRGTPAPVASERLR